MRSRLESITKTILVGITILFSGQFLGQYLYHDHRVAIIQDQDGYTNVREGQSLNSNIIDTLESSEFFLYQSGDTTDWVLVWTFSKGGLGYVHKSRILDVCEMEVSTQLEIVTGVIDKEIEVLSETSKIRNQIHDEIYVPGLEALICYLANHQNVELFEKFLNGFCMEYGSAAESPLIALGYIFRNNPEWTIDLLKKCICERIKEWIPYAIEGIDYSDLPGQEKINLKEILNELKENW